MKQPKLMGKLMICFFWRDSLNGAHTVKVVGVTSNKHGIKHLSVRFFNTSTLKYNGRRVKVKPEEWSRACCGVIYRGKVLPITDFNPN